jgi:hypothetical protein
MKWAKIKSWHIVVIDLGDAYLTRCGRRATTADVAVDLPMDEKSCETCLRLVGVRG